MTPLIRPSQEVGPHPELTQETVLEQQILSLMQGLTSEVGGLRGQVRDLRTVLMGSGDNGETAFGRLPMVEKQVAGLETRTTNLETQSAQLKWYRDNASGVGRWMATMIGMALGGVLTGIVMLVVGKMILGK
jgi:hypothetical protein